MHRRIFLQATIALIASTRAGAAMDSSLHEAALANDAERVAQLLAAGAQIDSRDDNGATALLVATHANAVDPHEC